MDEPDSDFFDYYFEAAMVHDHPHGNMYIPALGGNPQLRWAPPSSEVYQRAEAAGFNGTNLYLYPPLLADLLIPISQMHPDHAALLWRGMNLLLVGGSMLLVATWIGIDVLSAEAALLLFMAYTFWPIHEAISQGQISIVLLALWTIGIVAYTENRAMLSAFAFALATWFKVTPILIVPVFLLWGTQRDRKWFRWYVFGNLVLGALVVLLNGFENLALSFRVLTEMGGGVPALGNKSINSVVWWFFQRHPSSLVEARALLRAPQPFAQMILTKVLPLGFYLACVVTVRKGRWTSASQPVKAKGTILAVFAIVLSLISPVSWRHGYSVGLIILTILWINALRSTQTRLVHACLLAITTFSVGSLFSDLAAQLPLPGLVRVSLACIWPLSSALLCLDVLTNTQELEVMTQGVGNASVAA